MQTVNPPRTTYWRWFRLCALFSFFSLFAFAEPNPVNRWLWWMNLGFLFFLLPVPSVPRTQP